MAEVNPPYALQSSGILHPALLFRRALQGLLPLQEGVSTFNGSGDMLVKPNSPVAMSVLVQRGGAFVHGDDVADQGAYFVYNDGDRAVTIAASNPTNPRIDLVVAHVKDTTLGQTGDTWVLEAITGTPSGSPVAPALPATALLLSQISVPALATSVASGNITDKRVSIGKATPAVRVSKQSAQQNLPSSTDTGITWDTVEFDDYGYFNAGVSTSRLTVPSGFGGKYICTATAQIEGITAGPRRNLKVWKNGVGATVLDEIQLSIANFAGSQDVVLNLASIVNLADGDYVTASAYQDSGSTVHVLFAQGLTHLELARLA